MAAFDASVCRADGLAITLLMRKKVNVMMTSTIPMEFMNSAGDMA